MAKHKCIKCDGVVTGKSDFCSEKCRRNWRYHNVPGVKEADAIYSKNYQKNWGEKNERYAKIWGEKNPGYAKMWREKNLGYYKKFKEDNPEKIEIYKKRWAKKNPEKIQAWKLDYKLRKETCEHCDTKKKLEFHHVDYKKHLGITLCRKCHIKLHKTERGLLLINKNV